MDIGAFLCTEFQFFFCSINVLTLALRGTECSPQFIAVTISFTILVVFDIFFIVITTKTGVQPTIRQFCDFFGDSELLRPCRGGGWGGGVS